ncbi:MAG: mandelate racemase/muconate lactonizing enzyme family protein [Betaproteobacteria bacterium]|nr:mandelate racemase/muconate lactonizing enzyme family protein [Betaproteobacteria bacterium]
MRPAGEIAPHALKASTLRPADFAAAHAQAGLAHAGVVCAIDQALWDLHAQWLQRSLAEVLGARRQDIPVYANINRRTEVRTPEGFAASARLAADAGHQAFKVAPFDEVSTAVCAQGRGVRAMQAGLERIAAVRSVVGPRSRLMVDCHWRFDEATALELNLAAAKLGVYWIECPLPEVDANIQALVRLRRHANGLGMRLAGLEQHTGWASFRPYCKAGAYDVVMPDIKYVGGIAEMLRLGEACQGLQVQIAPHNPSGPICHAASLQLAACVESFDMLELQFDESPLFDALVHRPFAPVRAGVAALPQGPGLGVQLNGTMLQAHAECAAREWTA